MIWMPFDRKVIMAWCEEPLSYENTMYRVEVLARAFGLGLHYMIPYCLNREGIVSMGPYLAEEIMLFCVEHPEVSLNQPTEDTTFFADLDTDSA